ncbi:hypothetical protein BDW67DRAFT_193462 [Aspergillus spinulosporus]
MNCSKEGDLPPKAKRRRITNACLQCQKNKKRCDGGSPRCTSCTERQLACTYVGVRRRGQGRTREYLEKLEARVSELEISLRQSTSAPVRTANSLVGDETFENNAQSTLSDGLDSLKPGERSSELETCPGDHKKAQLALRERLFSILPEPTGAEKPNLEVNYGPFTSPIFIRLPQKSHLQSLFEVAFVELNQIVPVFDVLVLQSLLEDHFSHSTVSRDYPQRWAMLNAAVAVAIQLRTASGSHSEMMKLSWAFFKNAFSMYSAIILRGTDILGLEALLAMALYTQGSSDIRTTSVLVCAAARLSLTLGLHTKTYYSGRDLTAANRSRRAFWVAYILDKDISVKTGLPSNFDEDTIDLDQLDLIVPDTAASASSIGSNGLGTNISTSSLFKLDVELKKIGSTVEKRLFSKSSSEQSVHQLLHIVTELDHQLVNWKASLPLDLLPGHINWSTAPMAGEPIALLHFAYYNILCEVHGFAAHLNHEGDTSTIRQIKSARISQASAASQIIQLLQCLPRQEQPGRLWHLLLYPMSACIALVSIVLESPMDTHARSCAQHVSDLVEFLRTLQRDRILEVQALLDLCCEFEKLIFYSISEVENGTRSSTSRSSGITSGLDACMQQILSYTHGRTSSIQLASGLMGNLPSLCSITAATFSGLVPNIQISSSSSLLAPSSLSPESYGFLLHNFG